MSLLWIMVLFGDVNKFAQEFLRLENNVSSKYFEIIKVLRRRYLFVPIRQGDSGSGLVVLQEGRWHLAGIVSSEDGPCTQKGFPGVYHNVASSIKWISEYVRKSSEALRQIKMARNNSTDAAPEAEVVPSTSSSAAPEAEVVPSNSFTAAPQSDQEKAFHL